MALRNQANRYDYSTEQKPFSQQYPNKPFPPKT